MEDALTRCGLRMYRENRIRGSQDGAQTSFRHRSIQILGI